MPHKSSVAYTGSGGRICTVACFADPLRLDFPHYHLRYSLLGEYLMMTQFVQTSVADESRVSVT